VPEASAYNFAIYSQTASALSLLLYAPNNLTNPVRQVDFNPLVNKSDDIWHCRVSAADAAGAAYYSFRTQSPSNVTGSGVLFADGKELLDPYANQIYFPPGFRLGKAIGQGSNAGQAALGVLPSTNPSAFDWGNDVYPLHGSDLVIYEMHVRGFTKNANSTLQAGRAGTYLGVIDKVPYLVSLGVTAVELMPVFCFEPNGSNYWGYMPMSFFVPHPSYASDPANATSEFRQMVKALHAAGIEVILDVVFNHTAENGIGGPTYGFKGLDNPVYYLTSGSPPTSYTDDTGTGNTLDAAARPMRRLLLDSLRFWVTEMHVDGFRFDLASVLDRRADGSLDPGDPPIFAELAADPALADTRLIAEPWDASNGYLLGRGFPGLNWMQWNGRFRDLVKQAVRGDDGCISELVTRIYGSDDLFPDDPANARHPWQSVNFVVSHDGFTLYDTVAYNSKHNEANGENNTDGPSENFSWNCGYEGDVGVPSDVMDLRRRQIKNFWAILMMSNGSPMVRMGDEFLQTQGGNSNPYNQDNATSWLDWSRLSANQDIFRFASMLIAFRKAHPSISRSRFWREDVSWFGTAGSPDFSASSHTLAYLVRGASQKDTDIYVIINLYSEDLTFAIQEPGPWKLAFDTSKATPQDIYAPGSEPQLGSSLTVKARSVIAAIK
jgi:glycogen operon protein